MADSAVGFILEHLSQLLTREAKLLSGVEDKILSLHNELEIINVFLKTYYDGKNKKINKEIEQKVVSQIRDVAHVAEDVIDTFVANVATFKRRGMLGRMIHGVDHAKLLREVSFKIDKIKSTLNEIRENKTKYDDFEESSDRFMLAREEEEMAKSLHLNMMRRNVEEDNVVGFVHESNAIISLLVEGDLRRNVVSIIGMGGLGKTTVARKVYNDDVVKKHFNCRAWVYVSNEYRGKDLLLGLLKHLMTKLEYEDKSRRRRSNKKGNKHVEVSHHDKSRDFSSLSEDELKKKVWECLDGEKYLLVLDDLWKKQDWDEIQDAFPDENRGSRILITSRHKEVASHVSREPPYYLQFLTEEKSWELFSKKVFRGEEHPSNLENLGRQIVKSCGGLPLSIVVLAGLLANKEKSFREWSKIVGHVNWYLTRDETQVKDIVLKLSYEDLPVRLKLCFLYLGIFPEDSEIHVRSLLERWVAERFIQETGSRNPDDVAEDYIYELIDRSLIQVAQVKNGGGVKTCRIHDLLRDLCISKGKEDKVFQVCTNNDILISTKSRRLSIHCNMRRYVSSSTNDHSGVRSLFSFDPNFFVSQFEWKWLSKEFKLVRVVIFQGNCCRNIHTTLGYFIHLRYLRIDSEYITSIPDSICNLQNLETLDMRTLYRNIMISFPKRIWKLKHLRHVYSSGPIFLCGQHLESHSEVMWNLQTISSIVLDKQLESLVEKQKFPELRKLGLNIPFDFKGNFPKVLQKFRHLNKLEIIFNRKVWSMFSSCTQQKVLQGLENLIHLSVFEIGGDMELPKCAISFPPNITKLKLSSFSGLSDYGMNAIANLTRLRILSLNGFPSDSFDLNCVGCGFPQLEVFHMRFLEVKNWKLANGAMSRLQSLVINNCLQLDDLPSELWSLTNLRRVHVIRPTKAMTSMLQNLEIKYGCDLIVE